MNYSLENYPHLVKVIGEPYTVGKNCFVCDNMTGACFFVEWKKLTKVL